MLDIRRIKFRLTDTEYQRRDCFNLYKAGKVGLKRAWILSGLEFHEFLALLQEKDIDPVIPDTLVDKMVENVESLTFEEMFPGKTKAELRKLIQSHDG